jgi:hypothetical protein
MQDRASAASLVTAGSVLLGPILASTVLLAAGCASSPRRGPNPAGDAVRVIRGQLGLPPPDTC